VCVYVCGFLFCSFLLSSVLFHFPYSRAPTFFSFSSFFLLFGCSFLFSQSPSRYFFELLSFFTSSTRERERLQYFSTPEAQDELRSYNQSEFRSVCENLEQFSHSFPPLSYFFDLAPPLRPRPFSISDFYCEEEEDEGERSRRIELTIAVVDHKTKSKRRVHRGLCTSWLENKIPSSSSSSSSLIIPVKFEESRLSIPPLSSPLLLVGPGTGCAVCLSFIRMRRRKREELQREKVGEIAFFFGCRHPEKDWLYREEMEKEEERGEGEFLYKVAFSRKEKRKEYVQHMMKKEENMKFLREFIVDKKAWVIVSGRSLKMPDDVKNAIIDVVASHPLFVQKGKEEGEKYVKGMERERRLQFETW